MELIITENRSGNKEVSLSTMFKGIIEGFLLSNPQYPMLKFPESSFDLGNLEAKNLMYTAKLNPFK